jgi:hypothetical protein
LESFKIKNKRTPCEEFLLLPFRGWGYNYYGTDQTGRN